MRPKGLLHEIKLMLMGPKRKKAGPLARFFGTFVLSLAISGQIHKRHNEDDDKIRATISGENSYDQTVFNEYDGNTDWIKKAPCMKIFHVRDLAD